MSHSISIKTVRAGTARGAKEPTTPCKNPRHLRAYLPELGTDLVTTLSCLNVNDLAHVE